MTDNPAERRADVAIKPPVASWSEAAAFVLMVACLIVAPLVVYPVFLMKALCFALFACAFNLLLGYVGLLSFGHALFFGWASYAARTPPRSGDCRRSWRSCSAPPSPPVSD